MSNNDDMYQLFQTSKLWFIGEYVHGSINFSLSEDDTYQWNGVWDNILRVYYECVHVQKDRKKFYWILTSYLAKLFISHTIAYVEIPTKILLQTEEMEFDEVEYALLKELEKGITTNFIRMLKIFISLAWTAMMQSKAIKNSPSTDVNISHINRCIDIAITDIKITYGNHCKIMYSLWKNYNIILKRSQNEIEKTACTSNYEKVRDDNNTKLRQKINDIISVLFESIYKPLSRELSSQSTHSTELLSPEIVKYWVHYGPVYWLWFHLTAASLVNSNIDDASCVLLKEFFNNIDVFIGCSECKHHFIIMRETDKYRLTQLTDTCDKFFINVHEMVRKNHRRNEYPVNFVNKKVSNMSKIDNQRYLEHLQNDYRHWWK